MSTAGGSFSPRVTPRPKYPAATTVFYHAAMAHLRDAIAGCALAAVLLPLCALAKERWSLSEQTMYVLLMSCGHTIPLILFNGTLELLVRMGNQTAAACKIPRKASEEPPPELWAALLKKLLVSHGVVGPITSAVIFYRGFPSITSPLPSYGSLLAFFAMAHCFNDWGFYWTHRAFHHPKLYARFHKQHHTFKGTVGPAAEFAGDTETIVANYLPSVGWLVLVGAHPVVQASWLVLRLWQTYEAHSGYIFDGLWIKRIGLVSGSCFHDHHHTVNLGNFGAPHMDYLFGTMDHWVRDGCDEGYLQKRFGDAHPPGLKWRSAGKED